MLNKISLFILSFFIIQGGLNAESIPDPFLDEEIDQLSFYMGYLIGRDHAKNAHGFPTKFGKLVEGMKAGMKGEPVEGGEELIPLIKRMQKTIVEKQAAHNLQEAESCLKALTKEDPTLVEVVPSKLFYHIEKPGEGSLIETNPWMHFEMSEWKDGELHVVYSTYGDMQEPLQVDLDGVIPGFFQGVQGMRVGEERTIYVHPDLAFGLGKLDIEPHQLIVFKVMACQPH